MGSSQDCKNTEVLFTVCCYKKQLSSIFAISRRGSAELEGSIWMKL